MTTQCTVPGDRDETCAPIIPVDTLSIRGKKGAAFTLREAGKPGSWEENLPRVLALRPYWNYSWGIERPAVDLLPDSIEFLPMFWGLYRKFLDDNLRTVSLQTPRFVLCLNEPDSKKQSNVPVEDALTAWSEYESLGVPLVSPSCVSARGEWMEAFMQGVERKGLRVDAIGLHDYGGANANGLKRRLEQIYDRYKRPILVTEFAVADWSAKTPEENKFSPKQVLKFMQEILPWLEATPWILGYAWFSFSEESAAGTSSALFSRDGQLTTLGEFYASFQSNPELNAAISME